MINIKAVEISLCTIYLKQYENQKLDVDYTNKRNSFHRRIKNLNRQFPYDMIEMSKKHGLI